MEDDFLADSLILYIEKEITVTLISTDSIIDDFSNVKTRRFFIFFENCIVMY